MSITASESRSPLDESQAAARRRRLIHLTRMVYDLMLQGPQDESHPKYDGVEDAALIHALRACAFYTDEITWDVTVSSDEFIVKLAGTDGHLYVILFSLFGPGFSIQASRVRPTRLTLVEGQGQVVSKGGMMDVLQEHSKRLKLGRVTIDRAFLVGMSLVIGFMDDQDDDPDEDARLAPLSALVMPTDDELRQIRAKLPPSTINYDEEGDLPY